MTFAHAILLGVLSVLVAQRVGELLWARRNERRLRAHGAQEFGANHYPAIVLLHAGFLLSLAIESWLRGPQFHPFWRVLAVLLVAAFAFRYWCLAALGQYWNTKILVVPGARLVRRGPYKWFKHPNYGVVIAELVLYPLLFQAWWTLLWASALNAALLYLRISTENEALALLTENPRAYRN
ncbi:MAG: isoprenylcysteine carboxylmethyltransferase family protein [candidate division KSB1 bacterium]